MKAGKIEGKRMYGSHATTCREMRNKKITLACPHCNYSSRVYYITGMNNQENKSHTSSYKCPTHGAVLVNIGHVEQLPKNNKKRQKLIAKYRGTNE